MLTRHEMRWAWAFALALVLGAGGCADATPDVRAGADQVAASSTPAEGEPESSEVDGPRTLEEEIVALIDRTAESMGEPEPTDVRWVSSTRIAANLLISESVVGGEEDDVDVLVVAASGDFTVEGTSPPPDEQTGQTAPPPRGSFLTLILDATSRTVLDVGVRRAPVDLAELGEVHEVA